MDIIIKIQEKLPIELINKLYYYFPWRDEICEFHQRAKMEKSYPPSSEPFYKNILTNIIVSRLIYQERFISYP